MAGPGRRSTRTTTRRGDTIANVDRATLSITGPAVAFAVGTYAQSTEGANGVPRAVSVTPSRQRHPARRRATRVTNW